MFQFVLCFDVIEAEKLILENMLNIYYNNREGEADLGKYVNRDLDACDRLGKPGLGPCEKSKKTLK